MKILNKVSMQTALAGMFLSAVLGLVGPMSAQAATSPALNSLSTYGVVSDTFTNANTAPYTIVTGTAGQPAVCYTTLSTGLPTTVTGTVVVPCPPLTVGTDQTNALADVNLQASQITCTDITTAAITNLNAVIIGANPPGVFPPGCYKTTGAMNIVTGATITLSGAGTYIFKPGGALTTEANTSVTLSGGASACDVFWAPVGGTTLGAYTGALPNTTSFAGNIFRGDAAGLSITLGHFANVLGRLLAFGSTVTTDANTITVPTCAVPPVPGSSAQTGSINVIKQVINDNGGTKVADNFLLYVDSTVPDTIPPVQVGSGNPINVATPGSYVVTESADAGYTRSFSGDCNANGVININTFESKYCIITNNDIGAPVAVPPVPPLIDVVKVPSPLALPGGPGPVNYTYTVRNIGTVPMHNVTMVGDTCSPIILASGDTNTNNILEVSETWTYTCSTTLTATHTNTVVATGWANGISASDIASATVVVGTPLVPPLIHVTKVPSPLSLGIGGGRVTYTEKISNPGTVALSNVTLVDDKCAPVAYISGDTNGDLKLDTNEIWTYTCSSNLTKTTLNTATATGQANGFTVRDIALATVTVSTAVPALPNTGVVPAEVIPSWAIAGGILAAAALFYVLRKKQIV